MTTNRSFDRASDIAPQLDPRQLGDLKRRAEARYARVLATGTPREVAVYKFAMEQLSEADNGAPYQAISRLKTCPGMDQVLEAVAPVGGHESVS